MRISASVRKWGPTGLLNKLDDPTDKEMCAQYFESISGQLITHRYARWLANVAIPIQRRVFPRQLMLNDTHFTIEDQPLLSFEAIFEAWDDLKTEHISLNAEVELCRVIQMKAAELIPNFVPMWGRRVDR